MPTLSIVIPVYDEEKTIQKILDRIKSVELVAGYKKEVIVVNDCSGDRTEEAIRDYIAGNPDLDISSYSHEQNRGKGGCLAYGYPEGNRRSCRYTGCRPGI